MSEYYIKRSSDGHSFIVSKFTDDDEPKARYTLQEKKGGVLVCDCPAGSFSRKCKHKGFVQRFRDAGEPIPFTIQGA